MQEHPSRPSLVHKARASSAVATRPWLDDARALAEEAAAMIAALRQQDWPEGLWPDIDELAETWEDLASYMQTLSAGQSHPA